VKGKAAALLVLAKRCQSHYFSTTAHGYERLLGCNSGFHEGQFFLLTLEVFAVVTSCLQTYPSHWSNFFFLFFHQSG